jgi:CHAT domain-containing protein
MTWRGLAPHAQKAHPLFFFNACDVGQAQHVLNFVDGWAPAVLEAGASGYIGGLWPLADRGAAEFAVSFYDLVGAELPQGSVNVADALRKTRQLFYKNGDPTFLAYVYYGDPNLYLTR